MRLTIYKQPTPARAVTLGGASTACVYRITFFDVSAKRGVGLFNGPRFV
jgi:hypothetical protein